MSAHSTLRSSTRGVVNLTQCEIWHKMCSTAMHWLKTIMMEIIFKCSFVYVTHLRFLVLMPLLWLWCPKTERQTSQFNLQQKQLKLGHDQGFNYTSSYSIHASHIHFAVDVKCTASALFSVSDGRHNSALTDGRDWWNKPTVFPHIDSFSDRKPETPERCNIQY